MAHWEIDLSENINEYGFCSFNKNFKFEKFINIKYQK